MKAERIVLVLLALTVLLQATTIYRRQPSSVARANQEKPAAIESAKGKVIDLANMPISGEDTATAVIVEFSDFECPFCARHATQVLASVKEQFVSTGKVRYAFANNPLAMHKNARLLASAALCAGEQGKYWSMHDQLFKALPKSDTEVTQTAEALGLNVVTFRSCLNENPAIASYIDSDIRQAKALGLTATPAFAIGTIEKDNQMIVRKLILGARPLSAFEEAIKELLGGAYVKGSSGN